MPLFLLNVYMLSQYQNISQDVLDFLRLKKKISNFEYTPLTYMKRYTDMLDWALGLVNSKLTFSTQFIFYVIWLSYYRFSLT